MLIYQFEHESLDMLGRARAVIYDRRLHLMQRRPWQATVGAAQHDAFAAAEEIETEVGIFQDLFGAKVLNMQQDKILRRKTEEAGGEEPTK